ncbi:MAG: nickel-type superoxide dismutase maturation protease [Candidatus Nanopelagicales bacterium]
MARLPWFRVAVSGDSMAPTLREGQWWVAWRTRTCRPGDIVVMEHPEHDGLLAAKRAIRHEDGGWWVEGDNPDHSRDSRHFGPVPDERIVGRLVMRYR